MIALDSNVVIDLLRRKPQVRRRFDEERQAETPMFMSVLCLEELLFGMARSPQGAQERVALAGLLPGIEVLPFELADAEAAGRARAEMSRLGKSPPQIDLLIGSHALARSLTLVTANTRDFQNIPGLKLVDWTQPPEELQD